MIRTSIKNRLNLHLFQTRKFKTNVITLLLRTPLSRENATKTALVASLLEMGCDVATNEKTLAIKLEEMYGATFDVGVIKKGDEQIIQLYIEVLDGEALFEDAGVLLESVLLEPVTENGGFATDYVNQVKLRLKNLLNAAKNDKKDYAKERMIEIMFDGEPFGVRVHGYLEDIERETPQTLYAHYLRLLSESRVELGVVGNIDFEPCRDWALRHFGGLGEMQTASGLHVSSEAVSAVGLPAKVREVKENENSSQAKLVIGARCGFKPVGSEFYTFILLNEILGGGASSKLFRNVREAHNLCYYVNSILYRSKAAMLIQAGIAEGDYERVKALIEEQIGHMANGSISTSSSELAAAKSAIEAQMEKLKDSPQEIMEFYLSNALVGDFSEIDDAKAAYSAISVEEISACAKKIRLDTCYLLT